MASPPANNGGLDDIFDEESDPAPGQLSPTRDEDDSEDDSDENEEEQRGGNGPPKKRRRRTKGNRFIDIEAEVDEDDEEDDDDDRHGADGFIVPGMEDDTPDAQLVADSDRRHRDYDRIRQGEAEQDALKLAAAIDARDKQRRATQRNADEMGAAGLLPRTALMPDIDDPTIWAVKVKQGRERDLILQVARKGANMDLNISACFCRDSLRGYLYVEARSEEYVKKALHGMVGVYSSANLMLIPLNERADLLTTRKKEIDLQVNGWVRFKRPWQYAGDIAQIVEIPDNAEDVLLRYIPRIDFNKKEDDKGADGKKRKKAGGDPSDRPARGPRPPQAFFNAEDVKKAFGQKSVSVVKKTFHFQNEEYEDGYLLKYIRLTALQTEDVHPSIEEIQKFAGDRQTRSGKDGEDDDGDKTDAMNLNMIAEATRKSAKASYQPGDSVKIIEGALNGVIGTISSILNDKVTIQASPLLHPDIIEPIETDFSSVRKQFKIGDHVKVLSGKNSDETGLVVQVGDDTVSLLSDLTGAEISAFAKDVREAAEVGGGINSVGEYELHDFVLLDEHTAAVIYKIERNILRVVDQTNATRSVAASSVRGKVPTSAQPAATDSNGQSIAKGDTMRESGEHITNRDLRSGNVLYVYKGLFAFLFNREIIENGGVFVVYAQYLISEAARIQKPIDLSRMNNENMPAPTPPPMVIGSAAARPRRDMLQGRRVTCGGRGVYKGKEGIVLDIAGEWATVELSANNAKIKIEKNKLFVKSRLQNGDMGLVKALDAYKQRDFYPQPQGGGVTPNPYGFGGGKTPNPYATNFGRTPNPYAQGGKTPNPYAGSTTPNPFRAGNKTPNAQGTSGDAFSMDNRTPHANVGQSGSAWDTNARTPHHNSGANNSFNPSSKTPFSGNAGQSNTWQASTSKPAWQSADVQTPGGYNTGSARTPAATPHDPYAAPTPGPVNAPTPFSAPTPAPSTGVDPSRRAFIEEAERNARNYPNNAPEPETYTRQEQRAPARAMTGSNQAPLTNSRWGKPAATPETPTTPGFTAATPAFSAPTPGPMSAPTPGATTYRTPAVQTPGYSQTPGAYTPAPQPDRHSSVARDERRLPSDWPEDGLQVWNATQDIRGFIERQVSSDEYSVRFDDGGSAILSAQALRPVQPIGTGDVCLVIGQSQHRGQKVVTKSRDDLDCWVSLVATAAEFNIDARDLCVCK